MVTTLILFALALQPRLAPPITHAASEPRTVLLAAGAATAGRAAAGDPPAAPLQPSGAPRAASPTAGTRATTVALRWENDVISGTDHSYTNGVSITVARDGEGLLGGIWGQDAEARGRLVSSFEIGQMIITPNDIVALVPDPEDRPYAGMLYGALGTQFARGNRFDGFKLITGVVGPASLAEQFQRQFHRWTGSLMPRGWDYQLDNELILNAVYEHRRRYTLAESASGWSAEAIPMTGAMLGNVLTQAQAKAQLRFGYNVPDDFGKTEMRGLGQIPFPLPRQAGTSRAFGVYAFAGGGGTMVGRNLSLDGNTFGDTPQVAKKPVFAGGEVGVSVWTRSFEVTVSYTVWGREYDTQPEPSRFGAFTFAYRF